MYKAETHQQLPTYISHAVILCLSHTLLFIIDSHSASCKPCNMTPTSQISIITLPQLAPLNRNYLFTTIRPLAGLQSFIWNVPPMYCCSLIQKDGSFPAVCWLTIWTLAPCEDLRTQMSLNSDIFIVWLALFDKCVHLQEISTFVIDNIWLILMAFSEQ